MALTLYRTKTRIYYYDSNIRKTYSIAEPGSTISGIASDTEIDRYCEGFTLTKIIWPGFEGLYDDPVDPRLHVDSEFNLDFEVEENATSCGFGEVNIYVTDIIQEVDGSDTLVTIQGYTSNASLTYSIDGINYQVSNQFTISNANGGVFVAYIKDNLNYLADQEFDLEKENTYGTLYRCEFDDDGGDTYQCDIQKLDYTGSITEVVGGAEPLLITVGNSGTDKYEVFKGSGAKLELNSSTDFQFIDLFSATDLTYKLVVTKSGSIVFEGLINNEAYSEPYSAPGYFVKFEFLDGLGRLKRYPFERGGEKFTGIKSELEILKICLLNTGLSLPIHTAIDIYETGIVRKLSDSDGQLLSQTEYYGSDPFTKSGPPGASTWVYTAVGYENRLLCALFGSTSQYLQYDVDMIKGNSYTLELDLFRTQLNLSVMAIQVTFGNDDDSSLVASYTLPIKNSIYYKNTFVASKNWTWFRIQVVNATSGDGLILNRAFFTETPLATTIAPIRNPLAYVNVDCASFYNDENGDPDDCYEVIEKILNKYGARITQVNGAWEVLNIDLLQGSTYVKEKFTAYGAQLTSTLNQNDGFIDGLSHWSVTETSATNWSSFAGYIRVSTATWSETVYQSIDLKSGVPYKFTIDWFHNSDDHDLVEFEIILDVGLGTESTLIHIDRYGSDSDYVYWYTPDSDYTNVGVRCRAVDPSQFSLSGFTVSTHFEQVSPQRNLLNATSSPLFTWVNNKQTLSLKPGYKSATLFSKLKSSDNLIPNGDFSNVKNGVITNWVDNTTDGLMGRNSAINGQGLKKQVLQIDQFTGSFDYGENIQSQPVFVSTKNGETDLHFRVSYFIRHQTGTVGIFYYRIQCGPYFLNQSGEWVTHEVWIAKASQYNEWHSESIITDPIPTSGVMVVSILADQLGDMYIEKVSMSYSGDDDVIPDKKEAYVLNNDDYTFKPKDREIFFSDLASESLLNTSEGRFMFINNSKTTTSSWTRFGQNESQSIMQLLAMRIVNNHQRPTQVLAGDVIGDVHINSRVIDTINQSSKIFIVGSVSYDVKSRVKGIELLEIISESAEGSFDFIQRSNGDFIQLSNGNNIRKS